MAATKLSKRIKGLASAFSPCHDRDSGGRCPQLMPPAVCEVAVQGTAGASVREIQTEPCHPQGEAVPTESSALIGGPTEVLERIRTEIPEVDVTYPT